VEVYNADEQLKMLESWWRDNWVAVAAGLVLGVVVIAGWKAWSAHGQKQAMQASMEYKQLQLEIAANNSGAALESGKRLAGEFGGTPYAALGALALAESLVGRNDYDGAAQQLQWAMKNADDARLRHVARLRLARVLWAQEKVDDALKLLDEVAAKKQSRYAPLYAELRGDILASQGKRAEAQAAYESALKGVEDTEAKTEISDKLNELGAGSAVPANG
jgi:predicted negative regulator of RcsB-dependent stress response